MDTNDTNLMPKNAAKFICNYCDFKCSKESNFSAHLLTAKHKKRYKMIQKDTKKMPENAEAQYICECGKIFGYHSGLWRHKKKCKKYVTKNEYNKDSKRKQDQELEKEHEKELEKLVNAHNEPTDREMMMMLIKDNSEMKKMMMEIIKNGTHNTNNSHNKTFNLQFYLNEQCKDAMNISDFVNSIQLQLEDLEETGRLGYVDGISRIVTKKLRNTSEHKRPIHCKREILYIKDNGHWIKENENNDMMINMIKQVANKNMKKIPEWVKAHPNCLDSDSKENDKYLQIVLNSMSGSTDEEQKRNIKKIISKVAKEVTITK